MNSQASLRLNKSNAVWLGVCSGIADWIDVPAALVRVVYVIAVLFWPTLIFSYFVMYFCMGRDIFRDRTWDNLDPSRASEHFRKLNYRKPIHRNTRDKRIAGVCAGFADYLEVGPFWIRILTILSLFVLGPFTIIGYIACIFLLDPDPFLEEERRQRRRYRRRRGRGSRRRHKEDDFEHADYASITAGADGDSAVKGARGTSAASGRGPGRPGDDPKNSAEDCAFVFRDLEKRLRGIESYMTSKSFRLHCEIKRA